MTEDPRLAGVLEDAGIAIEPAEFATLLREAFEVVGRARASKAAEQLTKPELEELRRAGLRADVGRRAFDRVRAMTAAQTAVLLASTVSVQQAAERLGVDPSRIRQMLGERSLIAGKDGGEWRILDLQFAGGRLVPNIGAVARAFPAGMPLLAVANWLTTPEADLEIGGKTVSPLEWLSGGGDPDRVAALASDL